MTAPIQPGKMNKGGRNLKPSCPRPSMPPKAGRPQSQQNNNK